MSKKFLRKNEFRIYNNPSNSKDPENSHPAYIWGKKGHKVARNSITHARFVNGISTQTMAENPNKTIKAVDNRKTRISVAEWKNEKYYGNKLSNWRWSNSSRKRIRKFNKKFK